MDTAIDILAVLDRCCESSEFPMMDNGYVYLAANRLTLFRSDQDWGLVIEVFGYSVRAGLPDLFLYVFGSDVRGRPGPDAYVTHDAWQTAMADSPFHWHRALHPITSDAWIDEEDAMVAQTGTPLVVRGEAVEIPGGAGAYRDVGVELEEPPDVLVHEVCRWLAAGHRDKVLAMSDELAACFGSDLEPILQLDAWHHPDVVDDSQRPSGSACFQMLARVLETGDVRAYAPANPPNTHWSNWPDGGTL